MDGHAHNEDLNRAHELIELGCELVEYFAAALLLGACAAAALNYMVLIGSCIVGMEGVPKLLFAVSRPYKPVCLNGIKLEVGKAIQFVLLLLISADVIETLVKPAGGLTLESLYKLGLVAVIRTALSYFLGKEVEEIEHALKHHDAGQEDQGHAQPKSTKKKAH